MEDRLRAMIACGSMLSKVPRLRNKREQLPVAWKTLRNSERIINQRRLACLMHVEGGGVGCFRVQKVAASIVGIWRRLSDMREAAEWSHRRSENGSHLQLAAARSDEV